MNRPAPPFRSSRAAASAADTGGGSRHPKAPSTSDGPASDLRIGELAEMSGVTVRALRYYETRNLLESTRSTGGQRRYSREAVQRVQRIQELMTAGLSSSTIGEVLPCMEANAQSFTGALLERLTVERGRLDHQIAQLAGARDALEKVIATASRTLPGTGIADADARG